MSDAIDATLRYAVDSGQVPGIVAMATNGRDTLYQGAFGVRRLGEPAPMTLDSVFWIASMTKAITSVACLQLVEQGRVGLHQPLGAIVPKLSNPQVLEGFDADGRPLLRPAKREVTLHDLLTHTSGYAYEMWNADLGRYLRATGRPGMASGLVAAMDMPLAFDPGTRWEYGISTDWVGKTIEAITGRTLGGYIAEHITGPLGMVDTVFGAPETDRLVTVHVRTAEGGLRPGSSGRTGRPELESGGGGLYSTAPDYLRFLAALLLGGGPLLLPETVALMAQNQIGDLDVVRMESVMPAASNAVELFPGMTKRWGYGFLINTAEGHAGRSAGSLAWAGLPNCYYWLDLKRQVAGLTMTQILPFADAGVLDVLERFEAGIYAGLALPV
jgi:CubicO group peptidase (beta-lactamase class C family)